MNVQTILIIVAMAGSIVSFQNCSEVKFSAATNASKTGPDLAPATDSGAPAPVATDPGAAAGPGAPADPSTGKNTFQTTQVADFTCQHLTVLTAQSGDILHVPARDGMGECIAYKILDKIANSSSKLTQALDNDVISRDHDTGSGDPNVQRHPYLMGSKPLNIVLDGPRSVLLSGSSDDKTNILVDNFVVIGVDGSYKAYGTKDSTIDASQSMIQFKNQPLALTAFATGGTSSIAPLAIDAMIRLGTPIALDVRAEDCGGSREMSDIYLVFK